MSNNLIAGQFFGQVPRKKTSAASLMTEVVHTTKTSVPTHSHELGHFQLLLGGSYLETSGGKSAFLSPMTISWHRPGMTHKDEIGSGGGRFFMIEIDPDAIQRLIQYVPLPSDFYVRRHPLVSLAGRLYSEFTHWDTGSELIAEGLTLEMLAHLARNGSAKEKLAPIWLARVVDKLHADYLEEVTSNGLAKIAGVHPVYLASVFRRFHHQTIGEYVQRLRVEHASRLLADHTIALSEIAYITGFSDQSHFTRIFKRVAGTTPAAYRSLSG